MTNISQNVPEQKVGVKNLQEKNKKTMNMEELSN